MRKAIALLSALVLWGAVVPAVNRAPAEKVLAIRLTKPDIDGFLAAHNAWRARVGLRRVRWSAELAASAQRWSGELARDDCELSHDDSTDEGENLLFSSAIKARGRDRKVNPLTPRQVVNVWGSESAYYSYARNRCKSGRRCGHYVQIVWAANDRIGCGGSICANRGTIWVCRYDSPVIEDRRPY